MTVYLLEHVRDPDGDEDVKILGIYSTRDAAQEAIDRSLKLPGFRDHPDGFNIDEYTVDRDYWETGFGGE
jgi:hypothetical protein